SDRLNDKQGCTALQEFFLFIGCAKAKVLLLTDLHRVSSGQLGVRFPQISEDAIEHVKVSLSFCMSCCVSREVGQSEQRRSIRAHPYAGDSFHFQLYETTTENWYRELTQEVHDVAVRVQA